jgi:type IV pilus assembly protein PilW
VISKSKNFNWQGGFNLIELMVALTISVIIFGGASVVVVTAHKQNQVNTELQFLQESARFALEQLARDIRMSGYYGCVRDNDPTDSYGPIWSKASINPFTSSVVRGVDNPGKGDDLFLQYAAEITSLSTTTLSTLDSLSVHSTAGLSEGQVVMVGSCDSADIFVISKITGSVLHHETNETSGGSMTNYNNSDSLYGIYPEGSPVFIFRTLRYFIANDATNNNLPTLYRQVDGASFPFIPGVDSFQLQFGIDTSNDGIPDNYVSTGGVLNWSTVASVKIGFLLRTEEQYGSNYDRNEDAYPILVLDKSFNDDNSRVRRRLFQTTFYIRNSI